MLWQRQRPAMARPQIRPPIFIALQNAIAALLFALLLGAEIVRRLLYAYPQVDILWQLSTLANRTVMPVLQHAEVWLTTPATLLAALVAGVAIPLLAWWTRYWFATAVAGHVSLAILVMVIHELFRRGSLAFTSLDMQGILMARIGLAEALLLALSLLVLVMCIADHVAFIRFLASFRHRRARAT